MRIILLLLIAYTIIGVAKVFWLFLNKSILSPYFVLHPSLGIIIFAIFYQPVFNIRNNLMEYSRGKIPFITFFFSVFGIVIPLIILFYILLLIFT